MAGGPGRHYEVLGVGADATAEQIRQAYVRLARVAHPDAGASAAAGAGPGTTTGSAARSGRMAAINEAYRVLHDPVRRYDYDRSLRSGGPGAASGSGGPGPSGHTAAPPAVEPLPAPTYPWKLAAVMAAIGATVVLFGAAFWSPAEPPPPDNLIEPGSCVVIERNGDAREVTCGVDPAERIVDRLVSGDTTCPVGTEAHRDRQGRGTACLVIETEGP